MTNMRKVCSIAFILALAVSSLIMVQTASASAPIPPVPEFSVKYSIDAYNVEPTYKTDPYTGQTVIEQEGYTGYNKTIFTEIKTSQFSSTLDTSGNWTKLYYNVRFKGHYENEWKYYPVDPQDSKSHGWSYAIASQSGNTIVTLPYWQIGQIFNGGTLDVQVQALIGHDDITYQGPSPIGGEMTVYRFTGEVGNWSPTQTLTIGSGEVTVTETTASPTPASSTATPTVTAPPTQNPTATATPQDAQINLLTGLDWERAAIVGLVVVVAVLAVGMVVMWRKMANTKS